jgi:GNAT superfamily N-acetyltransferase
VSAGVEITSLAAPIGDTALNELADVLTDCVAGGASVNFMASFSRDEARRFFDKVEAGVVSGDTLLLGLDTPPNQPHRADVKKMLVHRSARGRGIGAALMAAVEEQARQHGRWLLVLDTVPGESGHRLYLRAGWQQSGTVPDYALFPDGRLCDTAIMWKRLKR